MNGNFMFQGFTDVRFFTGVVEDRLDPLQLGRVRVRLHAIHTKERVINEATAQGIPVDHLPWAHVLRPITSASMDGIGDSPTGLVEGSWVLGISRDGEAMNDLVVLGSFAGKPEDPPQDRKGKDGFVDPRTAEQIAASPRYINLVESRDPGYPPQDIPMGRYPQEKFLNEPDTNRLARGVTKNTIVEKKKKNAIKKILGALGVWREKETEFAAKYPYNHVTETESGHVIEVDDTPLKERISINHKSGAYLEFFPDGSFQVRSQKDNYEVSLKNKRLYAQGSLNVTSNLGIGFMSTVGPIQIVATVGGINILSPVLPVNIVSGTAINMVAPVITANGIPVV